MSLKILIVGVVLATFVSCTSNTPTANTPVFTPAVVRTSDGLLHRVNEEGDIVGIASPSEPMPPFLILGWDEAGTEAARASNRERVRKYQAIVQAWESLGLTQRVSEVNLNDLRDVHARLSGNDSKIEVFLGNEDFGNRLKFALDELDRQRKTPIGPYITHVNVAQGIDKGNHVTIGLSPDAPNFSESNSNQSKPTEGKSKVTVQIGPLYATNADSSEKSYAGGNGMPVTIVTSEGRLTKKASGRPKAYVRFDNVPCGETITIIIADYPANSEEAMYYSSEPQKRYIKCGKPVVDLGAFNVMFME